MTLTPCYVLLARDRETRSTEVVRVYVNRAAAEASMRILEWCRDQSREFTVHESIIEIVEPTR